MILADGVVRIATCQFAVGKSIRKNSSRICDYITQAAEKDADVVHFSECALSGYAGEEILDFDNYNWAVLKEETQRIMELAKQCGVWIALGSTHQLSRPNRPHNSLYIISPEGLIVDRYDKRFCTERDLLYYAPGNHFVVFEINKVRVALLICFDLRFPEIYRELVKLDVDVILQSFYNARQAKPTVHTHIMRQTMQCRAATNYFWVSMCNSSAKISPYPSCFIQPDGKIVGQLKSNRPGMMINTVDISLDFYDPTIDFRKMAMSGRLNNGDSEIDDVRSKIRDQL